MNKKIILLGTLLLSCNLALTGCSATKGDAGTGSLFQLKNEVSGNIFAMDTYMQLTAYGNEADTAINEALDLITSYDNKWSLGKENSELTLLNQNGSLPVSPETAKLYQYAYEMYQETNGALDPSIYPLVQLWGFPTQEYRIPSKEEIDTLIPRVDFSQTSLDSDSLMLTLGQDMQIDFGAVAKGYTSEKIMELFRSHGIESAMISLGGNIQCLGHKKDGTEWKIGIQNPDGGNPLGIVTTHDQALVTSGDYQRYFEDCGKKYHHILDPATGLPADKGITSITIVCQNATRADALSTALFVMGMDEACSFWKAHSEEFDFIIYTTEKELLISKGLEKCFSSSLPYTVIQ